MLGRNGQANDGLFYIKDQDSAPIVHPVANETEKAIKAFVRRASKLEVQDWANSPGELEIKEEVHQDNQIETNTMDRAWDEPKMWHRRLGHIASLDSVKTHIKCGLLPNVDSGQFDWELCTNVKYKNRFSRSLTWSQNVFRLQLDTKGKIETTSMDGNNFALTIVDEYSR